MICSLLFGLRWMKLDTMTLPCFSIAWVNKEMKVSVVSLNWNKVQNWLRREMFSVWKQVTIK